MSLLEVQNIENLKKSVSILRLDAEKIPVDTFLMHRSLERLEIYNIPDKWKAPSDILTLSKLKSLRLEPKGMSVKIPLLFFHLPLESLEILNWDVSQWLPCRLIQRAKLEFSHRPLWNSFFHLREPSWLAIKELSLKWTGESEVDLPQQIIQFHSIKELYLDGISVSQTQWLGRLFYLRKLEIQNCHRLGTLRELGVLRSLQDISLANCQLSSLQFLSELVNLKFLKLKKVGLIEDLKPLIYHNQLQIVEGDSHYVKAWLERGQRKVLPSIRLLKEQLLHSDKMIWHQGFQTLLEWMEMSPQEKNKNLHELFPSAQVNDFFHELEAFDKWDQAITQHLSILSSQELLQWVQLFWTPHTFYKHVLMMVEELLQRNDTETLIILLKHVEGFYSHQTQLLFCNQPFTSAFLQMLYTKVPLDFFKKYLATKKNEEEEIYKFWSFQLASLLTASPYADQLLEVIKNGRSRLFFHSAMGGEVALTLESSHILETVKWSYLADMQLQNYDVCTLMNFSDQLSQVVDHYKQKGFFIK